MATTAGKWFLTARRRSRAFISGTCLASVVPAGKAWEWDVRMKAAGTVGTVAKGSAKSLTAAKSQSRKAMREHGCARKRI